MAYVTPAQLAERPGARELAQVASASFAAPVAADLMEATLRGTSRAAWTADQIAAADDALARIVEAVTEADSIIDGFAAKREYTLPFSPVPQLVTGWSRAIARYKLHQDRISDESTDPIARDYRDAMKLLAALAKGEFFLGASDPIATAPDRLDVQFESSPSVFGRDQLDAYR